VVDFIEEIFFVPGFCNTDWTSVASHSCTMEGYEPRATSCKFLLEAYSGKFGTMKWVTQPAMP